MSKKINKTPRRILTTTMSLALLISLSSCTGATNTYGKLDTNKTYAEVGNYTVTNGELWDELKWEANTVLEEQITNVVLNKQINKITLVMNKKFTDLSAEDKETLEVTTEDEFNKLYDSYSSRLVDYVVQHIYDLNYEQGNYWDGLELLSDSIIKISQQEYIDEIYSEYHISEIDGQSIDSLVKNASKDDISNYIIIANELSEFYYPLYAKELLAFEKLIEEVEEAAEKDDDEEDDKIGYFTNSNYTGKFKNEYTNTYDLNMIMIRFTSEDEFSDTLRAFGLKIYNKKLYFIKDNSDDAYNDYLESDNKMSYEEYITYYDEFKNTSLNKENGVEELSGEVILEIYIQLYNYIYSGYRTPLETNHTYAYNDINDLRANIYRIISDYSTNPLEQYKAAVETLKTQNPEETTFTSEDIDDISAAFKTYVYETLSLKDKNGNDDMNSRYSTATQAEEAGRYICYKFDDGLDELEDQTAKKYEEFYNPDLTTYEILDFILDTENNPGLQEEILEQLIADTVTENMISNYLTAELEDVKVKIFNEAVEITYSNNNSEYSKTVKKAKNKNLLATIEYDKKTWNLNITADQNDKNSICYPGTETKIGAFDILEQQLGTTYAIDILSNKIVKDTKAYSDIKADKKNAEYYEEYLKIMLVNFTNEGYSSSGFPSSIGKYNFLMLYFHTANVDEIINDYFLVQHASASLLTNYGNKSLSEFFKKYTDLAYKDYFSLNGTRMVAYMDIDDDNEPDELEDWITKEVEFEGENVTMEYVAKSLIYEVYNKISASSTSHSDKLTALIEEINNSARVVYANNPIVPENIWAKYRKLGLKVTTEEFSTTNSDVNIDFTLKQRLYDYARGYSDNGKTYQYFIEGTAPTIYMEPLTEESISENNDDIIATEDGYNLILVTTGNPKPSAEWKAEDNEDNLLTDIVIKYNEEYVTIDNVYNEGSDDKELDGALNTNQIQLYVLDYAMNGASTLSPASTASAITTFLQPIVTRYTSAETQRIILLNFIKNAAGIESTTELSDVVKFANEEYNGTDGYFANIITINQNIADGYNDLYGDTTNTSNIYPDWWENLQKEVENFLINSNKEVSE